MQTGMVIGLVPTKPVAINSALAFRNVVGDSCPHTTAPAAQRRQRVQTYLCSEDVNGLWKVILLSLELEALGYVLSLWGIGGLASHLVLAYWGSRTAFIFYSVNLAPVGGGRLKGISHWETDDPKIFIKKKT